MRTKSSSTSSAVGVVGALGATSSTASSLLPSASSEKHDKVYINANTLTVTGEKAIISSINPPSSNNKKKHRIEIGAETPSSSSSSLLTRSKSDEDEDLHHLIVQLKKQEKEQAGVKLNKCVLSNDQVFTRQVRKIRETVQTQDLERLLIGLTSTKDIRRHGRKCRQRGGGGGDATAATITTLNPAAFENIYHNFFGVYYDILHQVVRNNKMSSIT